MVREETMFKQEMSECRLSAGRIESVLTPDTLFRGWKQMAYAMANGKNKPSVFWVFCLVSSLIWLC